MAKTYGENFVQEIQDTLELLKGYSGVDYTQDQIVAVIANIGFRTELFLKGIIFPAESSRKNFADVIENLSTVGISTDGVTSLHELRRAYNTAKHEPDPEMSILASIEIVKRALISAREIEGLKLGLSANYYNPIANRLFWFSAWDHFAQGDTEIHIYIPGSVLGSFAPPLFDIVNIDASKWDEFLVELSLIAEVKDGKGLIPDIQYNIFSAETDFVAAKVYEGDYRTLLAVLSKYELRQNLLQGLNRHDQSHSILISLILAAIDTLVVNLSHEEQSILILNHAHQIYAIPENLTSTEPIVTELIKLFSALSPEDRNSIRGPVWVGSETFFEHQNLCKAESEILKILITADNQVEVLWKKD